MADGSDFVFLEGYLTSWMVCAERVNLALEALIVPCSICNSDFFFLNTVMQWKNFFRPFL